MGTKPTEIIFGFAIFLICPLMNWFQYQLFFLLHKMVGIHPTTTEKKDCSKLNGLIIFDAHSSTPDGKLYPFEWKLVMVKIIGYTLYVLPFMCIIISLAATNPNNDLNKSFIAPLQMNTTAITLVYVGILMVLMIVSILEQIEQPGKFHTIAKLIITIVFSLSIMVVPGFCSNISNMKLICLMNSNQEVCADVRPTITCRSEFYNDIGFYFTTEGNTVVENYFLNSSGTCYFNR